MGTILVRLEELGAIEFKFGNLSPGLLNLDFF